MGYYQKARKLGLTPSEPPEFTTGNVFVYDQVTDFPDYALDGSDPRSETFDFNKFKTEGTVEFLGNVNETQPTETPKPEEPKEK